MHSWPFPLKTYLLRPYPGKQSAELPKRIFNYRLSRARRVIENNFGILVAKWRIFRKAIIVNESNAIKIIKTAVVLHNWLRRHDLAQKYHMFQKNCSNKNMIQLLIGEMTNTED